MKITLCEVRRAFENVMQHLEDTGRSEFEAEVDYYWEIPAEARYNVYEKPNGFTIGQISEDIADVVRTADPDSSPIADDLRCLGVVLKLIGERWTY